MDEEPKPDVTGPPADSASEEHGPTKEEPERTAPVEATEQATETEEEAGAAEAGPATGKKEKPSSRKASSSKKVRDPALARAFRSRRPVQGKIQGVIKGGYEVRVGRSRAFCPHSQIDVHRVDNPEEHVGKIHYFLVHQYRRGGEDVVLSRRAYLESEQVEEAKAVRATLIEGAVMQGKVVGLAAFGAFVDLGAGVQGLVHISELSHTRVLKASDAVAVGDPVSVKILKLDGESGRISLSIRQAEGDPWEDAADSFKPGGVYPGTVQRVADFGAFVEMKPGMEALAPAREFPPAAAGWSEGLEPGRKLDWLVLSMDLGKRRMSVIPSDPDSPAEAVEVTEGATLTGKVQRIERFGIFVWFSPGQVGLMPAAWSGVPQGTRIDSRYRIAQEIEVDVVEVSEGGRKIRLAKKGVEPKQAPDEPSFGSRRRGSGPDRGGRARETSVSTTEDQSFGTSLGDKLRAALDGKEDESPPEES